jgi:hypothetical protein
MSYTSVKIEPLGKDNFDTWKIQIEALLIKNDSWKYVNGTIPKSKEPPEAVTTWESNDATARSDLILTICLSELKQIKNCPTSKDIMEQITQRLPVPGTRAKSDAPEYVDFAENEKG